MTMKNPLEILPAFHFYLKSNFIKISGFPKI